MADEDPLSDLGKSPNGYDYNEDDKIRKSHDVRVYDDGQIVLLDKDGNPAGSDKKPVDETDTGGPGLDPSDPADTGDDKEDNRASVDLRRTDILMIERGRGS